MTPEEFAEDITAYLLSRNTAWTDEDDIREAVKTVVGIIFYEARQTTMEVLEMVSYGYVD